MSDRIIDYLADIIRAVRGLVLEIEAYSRRPVSGHIYINGVESVTQPTPTDIPDNDVPCVVQWRDRLGGVDTNQDTTWSTEDDTGADASSRVTVAPDSSDNERGTVTFHAASGTFRVVATTQGANGPVRAQSGLYNIRAGAPTVGTITVQ